MGNMIKWLNNKESIHSSDKIYILSDIKANYQVKDLGCDAYLVLNWEGDWLSFAVLEISSSYGDVTELSCVFHGEGPSGSLRECRHTYWGEGGYLFYPIGIVIGAAFEALAEFYDGMDNGLL